MWARVRLRAIYLQVFSFPYHRQPAIGDDMQCRFRNEHNLCPKASCHGDGRAKSGGCGRPIAVTLQVGQVNNQASPSSSLVSFPQCVASSILLQVRHIMGLHVSSLSLKHVANDTAYKLCSHNGNYFSSKRIRFKSSGNLQCSEMLMCTMSAFKRAYSPPE